MVEMNSISRYPIKRLWPGLLDAELIGEHYARLWGWMMEEARSVHDNEETAISDLDKSLSLADDLGKTSSKPRTDVVTMLQDKLATEAISSEETTVWIDLTIRLWLTFEIRSTPTHWSKPLSRSLAWEENDSLEAVIIKCFSTTPPAPGMKDTHSALNYHLTAAFVCQNYGYQVVWTNDLTEHLQIDNQSKTISVFEHKIALWNHLRFPERTLLPRPIVEEAIDTLNLLFPLHNSPTARFLKARGRVFNGLGYCGRQRNLDLKNYPHWGRSIAELSQLMDEPPIGRHQLKLDDDGKNTLPVMTFWIAAFVAVLTIVSIVFGILSTYYSKQQYDLALLQYKLQIRQACAAPEAATQLSGFCD